MSSRRGKSRPHKSRSRRSKKSKQKFTFWLILAMAVSFGLGYKQAQSYVHQPEAIIVLGGHEERERFAARLAQQYPHLPIWVSSGSPKEYVEKIFANAGIKSDRLHLDYQATDTVTNFTTLVEQLKAQGINSVYLVTSDNHMGRARLIGEIVFGTRGIAVKPVSVPSQAAPEPIEKSLRDGARAILWLTTGRTGVSWRSLPELSRFDKQ